jgi:hypothetical protein
MQRQTALTPGRLAAILLYSLYDDSASNAWGRGGTDDARGLFQQPDRHDHDDVPSARPGDAEDLIVSPEIRESFQRPPRDGAASFILRRRPGEPPRDETETSMEEQSSGAAPASGEGRGARAKSKFVRFVVADASGHVWDVTPESAEACPALQECGLLRRFVANELGRRDTVVSESVPAHVSYIRRHELVDYCEVSERGHHKWYPKGLLMQRLILDYGAQVAREWGAFEMKNPLLIRGDQNAVGELMGEFHERDYRVDGGRGVCYLRYASDPLAFPFMQKVRFTHRQTPLKVYEEAICFRNEQEGEVSGLKRVRSFMMTDMHAACASDAEAKAEFERLCFRFAALMDDVVAPG